MVRATWVGERDVVQKSMEKGGQIRERGVQTSNANY